MTKWVLALGMDCDTLWHKSHTHDCFLSINQIPPKPIKSVDQTLFTATAIADLHVTIPNGNMTRDITLKQVLYCLDLVFTLGSLMRCNLVSYSALLKDQKCTISDPHRTVIGWIPPSDGLYKHEYAFKCPEATNPAKKILLLNDWYPLTYGTYLTGCCKSVSQKWHCHWTGLRHVQPTVILWCLNEDQNNPKTHS